MSGSDIDALNHLDREAFVRRLGDVFEHSPWVAEAAWARAPFTGLDALHRAMTEAVSSASRERRRALIAAHPDLAGRLAETGALTAASGTEQAGAGLDRLDCRERARFHALNRAYRERFGFPFVIAVAGLDKDDILATFEARLDNSVEQEEARAIEEIGRIARFRLERRFQTRP